jgi:hypothetical protein
VIYYLIIVTIAGGLLHETKTTGFTSEETCYEYAASALNAYTTFGHQIVEAECRPVEQET